MKLDARVGWLALSVLLVLCDQLTKQLVVNSLELFERVELLPVLSLMRLHNSGMAFGLFNLPGGVQLWIITPVAMIVSVYLVREILLRRAPDIWRALGFVLVLAGAIGNLIDRLSQGYVVDFVLMHAFGCAFPAYNLADMCITFGVAAWICSLLRESNARSKPAAKGFTLVEVVIVVLIIAVLAGIAVPAYILFNNRAEQIAAEGDLLNCGAALERLMLERGSFDQVADADHDGVGDSASGPPAPDLCSPHSTRYRIDIREVSQHYYLIYAEPDDDSDLPMLAYDAHGATLIDLDADGKFEGEEERSWH